MKAAIGDVIQERGTAKPSTENKHMMSNSSDSDSSDDEKNKKDGKTADSHKKPKNRGKHIKKDEKNVGGLPRKQFKRLIKKELDKQCHQIFNDLMNCKEIGQNQDDEQINSEGPVLHQNIECDGCGQAPI